MMGRAILSHLRANVIAYVALFAALGGSSYAAVQLGRGSVTSYALANGAVTHTKLAHGSVTATNIKPRSLTAALFKSGTFAGANGPTGSSGPAGATGPQGAPGGASVGLRSRSSGSVSAGNSASTPVPLSTNTWTQQANELDLIAGTMTVQLPASCTGSFGNALVISVDGAPTTFAAAPTAPASGTLTIPFTVGTLGEPGQDTPHTMTASFGNSCTKSGESFTVSNVKLDVIRVP